MPDATTQPPSPEGADATRSNEIPERANGTTVGNSINPSPALQTVATPVTVQQAVGVVVPGYEIEAELGRGAMGVVYKARHLKLNRTVGLKMVLGAGTVGERAMIRFLAEAEAVAAIRHPNVVQVYDYGESGGLPYMALEYLPGGTFADALATNKNRPAPERFTVATVADLLASLSHGVAAAHEQGIVHRDIKPGNILFDESGNPKVTDFGLAKRHHSVEMTATGAILGTPGYMSPEQASGNTKFVGPQADVWALGVILYECLTGNRPFVAEDLQSLFAEIIHVDPVSPRKQMRTVPRDLELICLKCLSKEPHRRYATAKELAADLDRFRNGQPVVARPIGRFERAVKWVRRYPGRAAGVVAVIVLFIAGLLLADHAARRVEAAKAETTVSSLLAASPADVPRFIAELGSQREYVRGRLSAVVADSSADPRARLNAAVATVTDSGESVDYLLTRLPTTTVGEVALVSDAVKPSRERVVPDLTKIARDATLGPNERLRVAAVLAGMTPDEAWWASVGPALADTLCRQAAVDVAPWAKLLRPVRNQFRDPLRQMVENAAEDEAGYIAGLFLAELFSDDGLFLLERTLEAAPRLLPIYLPHVRSSDPKVGQAIRAALAKPSGWKPSVTDEDTNAVDPSEAVDVEARRKARAALVLLHERDRDSWMWFRSSFDPRVRTYLIHLVAGAQIDPRWLLDHLNAEPDASIRQGILLALGEYRSVVFSPTDFTKAVTQVSNIVRNDPDSGVHSAARWVLQAWGQKLAPDPVTNSTGGWLANTQGQTFAVVRGPTEFYTGSPVTEWHRDWRHWARPEDRCRRFIPRSFAIGTTEVTVEQFGRMPAQLRPGHLNPSRYTPEPTCPVTAIGPKEAMKYCRWLGEQEGIPNEQQCYPPAAEIDAGVKPYPDYASRTGYRLPTEAEWEYSCRAGTQTRYHYGSDLKLLSKYNWWLTDTRDRTFPVGKLKPNPLGLFDVTGNAWEWCHVMNDPSPYIFTRWDDPSEGGNEVLPVGVIRGGAFGSGTAEMRSAHRRTTQLDQNYGDFGFRIARTLPDKVLRVEKVPPAMPGREAVFRVAGSGKFVVQDIVGSGTVEPREGTLPTELRMRFGTGTPAVAMLTIRSNEAPLPVTVSEWDQAPPWQVRYYPWKLLADENKDRSPTKAEWTAAVGEPSLLTETLPDLNIAWPTAGRPAAFPAEGFAFVATADWTVPAGTYEFVIEATNGVRVLVDGEPVLDSWRILYAHANRAEVRLTAGNHKVRVEAYHRAGDGKLRVEARPVSLDR